MVGSICELTAPLEVLKRRVPEREPTEEVAVELRKWVDVYRVQLRTGARIVRFKLVRGCSA